MSNLNYSQNVKVVIQGPGTSDYVLPGKMTAVDGRSGQLDTNDSLENKSIKSITSIGRDDPTTADAQRAKTVLRILQGSEKLLSDSPWIANIWFPTNDGLLMWPEEWSQSPPAPIANFAGTGSADVIPTVHHVLNPSQQEAVNTMYSSLDSHRITIIQGPPGTGKTSVIASFVQIATQTGYDGIWLVAQSNVAVKNIAEKLLGVGFMDWKLLVSRDFHFEWCDLKKIQLSNLLMSVLGMNTFIPKFKTKLYAPMNLVKNLLLIHSKIAKSYFALLVCFQMNVFPDLHPGFLSKHLWLMKPVRLKLAIIFKYFPNIIPP